MPRAAKGSPEAKAWAANMKAKREAKQGDSQTPIQPVEPPENPEPVVSQDQDTNDLKRQIEEMKQNMDLMRQLLVNNAQGGNNSVQMNRNGELIGEFEKYLVDPSNYPNPTPRLTKEPRLAPLAFDYNYELTYEVNVSSYETKTGKNIREPRFHVTLLRKVLDDQGNRVQVKDPKTGKMQDKFYIARKMVFHEDPQAAMVIARENNLPVDGSDERLFLNEMRYYRVRDWLFDIFWPRPVQDESQIQDEVIGGQVVQVFTRNSEETGSIPFDKMTSKLRV
jgi:hypothetical protein